MKVSVCMITYNHEKFISDAIDGVLSQQTNFDFELYISDDCSSDNTRKIIREYQEKFPGIIKLILPNTNLGMMPNFIGTLQACTGEYIAICEGDDYWINPLKLQKQVDFLESNPDYIGAFHRVDYLYQSSNNSLVDGTRIFNGKNRFSITDILLSWDINTCSLVFRNKITPIPGFFSEIEIGDQFIVLILALKGDFYYFNECMGVYRVHDGGVTAGLDKRLREIELEKLFFALDKFNNYSQLKYASIIEHRKEIHRINLKIERESNPFVKILYFIKKVRKNKGVKFREIKNFLNETFPRLYEFYPFKS